jgi:hypothetical protein
MRGITHKDKNQIIIEIILAIAKLDKWGTYSTPPRRI